MALKLNKSVKYAPNRGRWIETIKTKEIIEPNIVVTTAGLSFKSSYQNVFTDYQIKYGTKQVLDHWKHDPLQLYACCINFAVFCATSGLGLSLEHFRSLKLLTASIVRFHLYYHVRAILYKLKVKEPGEKGFDALQTKYDKQAYHSVCKAYGVDAGYDWRNQYVFSTYQGSRLKPLNNESWSRWIQPKSHGLTREGMEMLGASARIYVYCLLSAQATTRANIIGSTTPNFESQKTFITLIEDFIERDTLLSEDIARYENILTNARSSVDYSLGEGLYMIPSNLQLKIPTHIAFNDKLKITPHEKHTRGVSDPKESQNSVREELKPTISTTYGWPGPKDQQNVQPLRDQRISEAHKEEVQALLVFGSLTMVAVAYFFAY